MEYKELMQSLRQRKYQPVYLLHGEEPYFMDSIAELIEREVLTDAEKSFNQTILYGKDVDSLAVVDTARRYPMMAERQVVILKEAQDMKTLAQLQTYVEKPLTSTILLIVHKHKKLDMRSAFAKALTKTAVIFESKPLYDNQVPDWIRQYTKDAQLQIEPQAVDLLAEYLGTDLGKIANELDKIKINLVAKDAIVTTKTVEQFVGISREYNVFELQKALAQRNILQANKIIQFFARNPKDAPLVVVLSNLYNFFSKLYALYALPNASPDEQVKALGLRSNYFLKEYQAAKNIYPRSKVEQIIALLHEYDMKAKGVGADNALDADLMQEMVYRILH